MYTLTTNQICLKSGNRISVKKPFYFIILKVPVTPEVTLTIFFFRRVY